MSTSGSGSKTRTKTFPRLELIIVQFRRMIRRCGVDTTDAYVDKVCKELREGNIQTILIYGMDAQDVCHVEVSLNVDWDEHKRQLSSGAVTVSIDEDLWRDDMAIEVEEMIRAFNEAKALYSLKVQWRITLASEVNRNKTLKERVYRDLSLVDLPAVKWAKSTPVSNTMGVQELAELIAKIRFSE